VKPTSQLNKAPNLFFDWAAAEPVFPVQQPAAKSAHAWASTRTAHARAHSDQAPTNTKQHQQQRISLPLLLLSLAIPPREPESSLAAQAPLQP
jgi:hypothetical protein